jgi:hypothetical protein
MPGVGWCVRSRGSRYRIMFADGVALEVDVDEERVEMVERDGSIVRSAPASFPFSSPFPLFVVRSHTALTDESSPPAHLYIAGAPCASAAPVGRSAIA